MVPESAHIQVHMASQDHSDVLIHLSAASCHEAASATNDALQCIGVQWIRGSVYCSVYTEIHDFRISGSLDLMQSQY